MLRVKIFAGHHQAVQDAANEWLSQDQDISVTDVKFGPTGSGTDFSQIMFMYEDHTDSSGKDEEE